MDDLVERVARAMMEVSNELPTPDTLEETKHSGDCTKNSWSCQVCAANNVRHQARTAIAECFKWRPIESAPRDGTVVLLLHTGPTSNEINVGWWTINSRYPWAFVDDTTIFFAKDGDGNMRDCIQPNGYFVDDPPTHWLPLPEPPKEIKGGKQ